MDLDLLKFSADDQADEGKIERTKKFFSWIENKEILDAELSNLVKAGICLNARNDSEWTPLMYAAKVGRTDVVVVLIRNGADKDARDHSDWTPLTYAAGNGHTDIVKVLIAAGAKLEARDSIGKTELIWAAGNGHTDIVKVLIAAGAKLEARDNFGDTALMLALSKKRGRGAVVPLLERGANVYARDNNGNRPIDDIDSNTDFNDLKLLVDGWRKAYDDFAANGTAPKTKEEVYHLLAVTPLLNEKAPVDTIGHICRIMLDSKWTDMNVALEILSGLVKDCAIRPEDAADIQTRLIAKGPDRFVKNVPSPRMAR